ncbi:MAG: hypothetical protein KAR20_00320 [Candidatus Heimdallarchaeota archaeon]|nr:hypothetical protein [Candidatus Heimdallarchaeota archaeon]
MKKLFQVLILPFLTIVGFIRIVFAYIGPGSGLSAIGAFLAFVVGIFITILGFLWYPIKRLLGKGKKTQEPDSITDEED